MRNIIKHRFSSVTVLGFCILGG